MGFLWASKEAFGLGMGSEDLTFKARATRDRKDAMPSRLLVTQVLRIEDRLMWQRFASKRLQMAKSAPKRLEELRIEILGSWVVPWGLESNVFDGVQVENRRVHQRTCPAAVR